MAVITYLPIDEDHADSLIKTIKKAAHKMRVEIYHSLPELEERLRRSVLDIKLAILAFSRSEEIIRINPLCDFLYDIKIILILPDSEQDTIKKAHLLRPRYIGWIDSDFLDVGIVLEKMLAHSEKPPN